MKYAAFLIFFMLVGCDFFQSTPTAEPAPKVVAEKPTDENKISAFVNYFALNAYKRLSEATTQAEKLDQAISVFMRTPKDETLQAAREQWRLAYRAYLLTELYFYLPINDPIEWTKKGIARKHLLANIDSYPIEGGYIDYVKGYPFSGLVNDLAISIKEQTLIEQHGLADASYASLGFHVLEFLLWGESGERPASDYYNQPNQQEIASDDGTNPKQDAKSQTNNLVPEESVREESEPEEPIIENPVYQVQNQLRRRSMLMLVSDKLVKDLRHMTQRWELNNGYYARMVIDSAPKKVLSALFKSSQKLLESVLLDKRIQEGSSVFSHTTGEDIKASITGLRYVYHLDAQESEQSQNLTPQGVLLFPYPQLSSRFTQLTKALEAQIDIWQANPNDKNKAQLVKHSIQFLQLIYDIAKAYDSPLKQGKGESKS